jgi:intracellular sulfur oxidation DsrE/DsrF family protein
MHRRNILAGALAGLGALTASAGSAKRANAEPSGVTPGRPDSSKVVYHLCDLDKVSFVIGNIRNHFDGMGGPEKVTIALVVHGPALKAFHAALASPDLAHRIDDFAKGGLELNACGNTMKSQNVTLKELLPGFIKADRGGVVRIAELQSMGYVYLRP